MKSFRFPRRLAAFAVIVALAGSAAPAHAESVSPAQ